MLYCKLFPSLDKHCEKVLVIQNDDTLDKLEMTKNSVEEKFSRESTVSFENCKNNRNNNTESIDCYENKHSISNGHLEKKTHHNKKKLKKTAKKIAIVSAPNIKQTENNKNAPKKMKKSSLQTLIHRLLFSKKLINKVIENKKQRLQNERFQSSMSEYAFTFPETEDSVRYKNFLNFWEVSKQ